MQTPHRHLRPHAQPAQVAGEPVRPRVQLAVGERRPAEGHRDGVRRPRAPAPRRAGGCTAPRGTPRWCGSTPAPARAPSGPSAPAAERRRSASSATCSSIRSRCSTIRRAVPRSNRSVLYVSAPRQPVRRAPSAPAARSNLAVPASASTPRHRQPRQPAGGRGLVAWCSSKSTWKSGGVAQAALRPQLLHQPLEGDVLVLEGAQRRLAHPPQHLAEGRVAGQVRPQHQRVHEEADQPLHSRRACARRWWCPPRRRRCRRSGPAAPGRRPAAPCTAWRPRAGPAPAAAASSSAGSAIGS